ncbi:MAG: peptidoglycan-binding domain-containing protein [Phormidium sp.]
MPSRTIIGPGSKGKDVVYLQQLLNKKGYSLKVDGDFGKRTEEAVKNFQKRRGLKVDGIVGPATWNALLS